jgi:OCT family organic cation transporter-like MFS transporter 4/5
LLEIVELLARYRVIAGTLCMYYYTFGYFLMAGISYFLNYDWRTLQIVLAAPAIIFIPYWWFMPESVRWLIRKGRHEEARKQVEKVARVNGKADANEMIDEMLAAAKEEFEEEKARKDMRLVEDIGLKIKGNNSGLRSDSRPILGSD